MDNRRRMEIVNKVMVALRVGIACGNLSRSGVSVCGHQAETRPVAPDPAEAAESVFVFGELESQNKLDQWQRPPSD